VPANNVNVVGASAGGIAALRTLLNKLPENTPAAILVVVHTSPDGPGMLATVVHPEDGMLIRDGCVYVAPPDYHLIVNGRHAGLTRGPREHRFRPAVIEENIELRSRMKVRATDRRLTAFITTLDREIANMKERAAALRRLLLDPREEASTPSGRGRNRQSHG